MLPMNDWMHPGAPAQVLLTVVPRIGDKPRKMQVPCVLGHVGPTTVNVAYTFPGKPEEIRTVPLSKVRRP